MIKKNNQNQHFCPLGIENAKNPTLLSTMPKNTFGEGGFLFNYLFSQ
jgi:hypothetical protein